MISLKQKAEILLKYFREGESQREISRTLGISRKTVRKYIKEFEEKLQKLGSESDEKKILLLIEEMVSKPKYDTSKRKKVKLTDEVIEIIDKCLEENEKKKLSGKSKQIMKKIDIHEYLIEKGYDISYTTVCNYIREKGEIKEAFIRQEYMLGETLEFDWGEVKLNIDGKDIVLNIGLFTTAKGSYHYARLYRNKKMENFLDIHVKAFENIGGIHKEIVYDNMKQAVKKFVGPNEKEATEDLIKLSLYYGFRYRFCNARSGNEKGHVERGIEYIRRKVFSRKEAFGSIEEANKYLQERLNTINSKSRSYFEGKSPKEILEEERNYLLPLKPRYDVSRREEVRVNKYSTVNIDQNKYSVPDYLVGKFVVAKIYPEAIEIFYKDSLVASHKRCYSVHQWIIDINHFIHTLKKKPGALHSSAGRHQMCPELQQIYQDYYINNPKDFIVLLELIKQKGLKPVLEAVKKLSQIKRSVVNTDNIKSIILNRPPSNEDYPSSKDSEIEKVSVNLIKKINDIFNMNSEGGLLNWEMDY